jgi:hypothetical protein
MKVIFIEITSLALIPHLAQASACDRIFPISLFFLNPQSLILVRHSQKLYTQKRTFNPESREPGRYRNGTFPFFAASKERNKERTQNPMRLRALLRCDEAGKRG